MSSAILRLEDLSLPQLFNMALDRCEPSGCRPSTGDVQSSERQEAQQVLQRCDSLIESLALFSANEDSDDIATADLKYLLVLYYLAELQGNTLETEPILRKQELEEASSNFSRFLQTLDRYSLIPAAVHSESAMDAQSQRQLKIARFKREKELKARLSELQLNSARNQRIQKLTGEKGGEEECDSETNRSIWLSKIELAALKASEQISLVQQEINMLAHAASIPAQERSKPLPPPPQDLLNELQKAAAGLQSQRDTIRARAFRPSHNLPTRTLRDQAEIEMEQADRATANQAKAEKARKELESDEEYAIYKQRAWDDWKDDNPRGAGNSKLRPTA